MKVKRKFLPLAVTTMMIISLMAVIPASAVEGPPEPPEPVELWTPYPTDWDVTDIAVGDLNGDNKEDVVAIEESVVTLTAISGKDGTMLWEDESMWGYAVAIGDIDGKDGNEVIAGGWDTDYMPPGGGLKDGFTSVGGGWVLNAYAGDGDGTPLWSYPTDSIIRDIEIGDVDGDKIDDVVACDPVEQSWIYALDGEGNDLPGLWPVRVGGGTASPGEMNSSPEIVDMVGQVVDLAVGQLDGEDGMDVAAIGESFSLYVYNSTGSLMWSDISVSGRTVEIGNVDGDTDNEVVAANYGTGPPSEGFGVPPSGGWVFAFDGDEGGLPLYSFYTADGKHISDIELGDLDGERGVEVAAITEPVNLTLFAIDIDDDPADQEMWRHDISWDSSGYYGESLAIGDVDRDYKPEVVAASETWVGGDLDAALPGIPVGRWEYCIYAFDGLDSNDDDEGDLVWSPYCVDAPITDVEIGDIDGDGDQDVAFGTMGGRTVYALAKVENTAQTATGTGKVYFDSDPSTLGNLTAVAESELPEEGKPDLDFPHGFFSFNITGLTPGQDAIVTITLPEPAPEGTQYWKYGPTQDNPTGQWYQIPIEDDDGDKVITITLTDGGLGDDDLDDNGEIVDQGGPGYGIAPVGGEAYPVNKISILAPWIGVAMLLVGLGAFGVARKKQVAR
jgi:hypothetical protein